MVTALNCQEQVCANSFCLNPQSPTGGGPFKLPLGRQNDHSSGAESLRSGNRHNQTYLPSLTPLIWRAPCEGLCTIIFFFGVQKGLGITAGRVTWPGRARGRIERGGRNANERIGKINWRELVRFQSEKDRLFRVQQRLPQRVPTISFQHRFSFVYYTRTGDRNSLLMDFISELNNYYL